VRPVVGAVVFCVVVIGMSVPLMRRHVKGL
jgi:hypothetical protein